MTVPSSEEFFSGPYAGNSAAVSFDYGFKIYDSSELTVQRTNADATEDTLVHTTDYLVTGVGTDGGGTVELVNADRMPTGAIMYITPNITVSQDRPLSNQSTMFLHEIEQAQDKQTSLVRQAFGLLLRSVKLPVGSLAGSADIVDGSVLVGGAGNSIVAGPTVDEVSLADARAAAAALSAAAAAADRQRAELASQTFRPLTQQVLVAADFQALTATQGENNEGHDQVAVVRDILDGMALHHPNAHALFVNGDVTDEGGSRDTNTDELYTTTNFLDDCVARLAIPRDRLRLLWGNHDRTYGGSDGQLDGSSFHNARRALGAGNVAYVEGTVVHLALSDQYPATSGAIPRHVRTWFKQWLELASAMRYPVFVHSHQAMNGTGLGGSGNGDPDDGPLADSMWFRTLLNTDGITAPLAWFSGHGGNPNDADYHSEFAGCHFFNANMSISGAYNTATPPAHDLLYYSVTFTEGSQDVLVQQFNHTAGAFDETRDVTLTHSVPIQLAGVPQFDGRFAQDRNGIIEGFGTEPVQLVSHQPREPANRIDLASNPLSTTDGSSTVVVTHVAHGYGDGEEVNLSAMSADDLGGVIKSDLMGWRYISLIDVDTYSVRATALASATAVGGSGTKVTAEVQEMLSEPSYGTHIVNWVSQGLHAVGMRSGLALFSPYAAANGGAGPADGEDVSFQRGYAGGVDAKLLDLVTRAQSLMLSATTGPYKSRRVDVLELHPTEGAKDLVSDFMFHKPVFQVTEQDNVTLSTADAAHRFTNLNSSADLNVGGHLNATAGRLQGRNDGDIWELSAYVSFSGGTGVDDDLSLYFEHHGDLNDDGLTVKTKLGKVGLDPSSAVGASSNAVSYRLKIGAGECVYLVLEGASAATTANVNRVHWGGKIVSTGNV